MGIAVGGVERIPRSGPAVVIAPHFAFLDAFPYLSLSLPRPARFLASAYFVFANRILCRLMYVGGVIPVWRHRPDPTGVRKALRALARGEVLALFPEGGRRWSGAGVPVMPSAAKLLARLQVPIYVVSLEGMYDVWPRWARRGKPRRVRVGIMGELRFPPGTVRGAERLPSTERWWTSVYQSGGKVDVRTACKTIRLALAEAAGGEPRRLDLSNPQRFTCLPSLLCFCPDCLHPGTVARGLALSCPGCDARWTPAPDGRLANASGKTPPEGLEQLFFRMLDGLADRARHCLTLVEHVEVRNAPEAAGSDTLRNFVPGTALLSRRGLELTAGGHSHVLPVEAAAAGVMEGTTMLELHHDGYAIQLRSSGALRLYLGGRALAGLPAREVLA